MEVKIGMQNVARELLVEVDRSEDEVMADVNSAMTSGSALVLQDAKGKAVVVASAAIAYVEVGGDSGRKVGFGLTVQS